MNKKVSLEMRNICKKFPGVYALKNVNFKLEGGEVHALIGENGAGKSTLMKILGGVHKQDNGEVIFNGKNYGDMTTNKAIDIGVGFVHQELNLAGSLSIAENIFMGRLPYKNEFLRIVDYDKLYKDTNKILNKIGIDLEATEIVDNLSTAEKQLVEIARAISMDANIIIFDEPTTSLIERDIERLFKIIKQLKKDGVAVVYISHRLNEIFEICDKVTILRDGEFIEECEIQNVDENYLIRKMVGRDLDELYPKEKFDKGPVALEVKNLSDYKGKIKDVSFNVRYGEVVGFAGLAGSGRTELMRLIFGADRAKEGEIFLENKKIEINSPKDAIENGICLLTEDRKNQGLALQLSVVDNINMPSLKKFIIDHEELDRIGEKYKEKLEIKVPTIYNVVGKLSGGNQQKVVLAKWLNTNSKVFIFDEPTKGIDVGTKTEIYQIINDLVREGKIVIIVSSELPELLGMSDRIYTMCEGRIAGELDIKEATQEKIMQMATGGGTRK